MISDIVGTAREVTDRIRKGESEEAILADHFANNFGQVAGLIGNGCNVCWNYIPNGLPERYWIIPDYITMDQARRVIRTHTRDNRDYMRLMGAAR